MKDEKIWEVLGIEPGSNEEMILAAYREKLVGANPEDDPEGFKLLREAYEAAISMLHRVEKSSDEEEREKTPAELLVDKAAKLYFDVYRRNDPAEWEEFFSDPLIEGLDTIDEVRKAFLIYTMEHFVYSTEMWKEFDRVFRLIDEEKTLVEEFPADFISFIKGKITDGDYFTYNDITSADEEMAVFVRSLPIDADEGYENEELDCKEDVYLRSVSALLPLYYSVDNKYTTDEDKEALKKEIAERIIADRKYDIFHPFEGLGQMMYYHATGDNDNALKIAEYILSPEITARMEKFCTSYAAHIVMRDALDKSAQGAEQNVTELDMIAEKLQQIIGENPKFQMAYFALAEYFYIKGDYVNACEYILNASEYNDASIEIDDFIDKNDIKLKEYYKDMIERGEASDNDIIELGWCYLRDDEFENEDILKMLDDISPDPETEYNYYNLYARCCVKMEDYKRAEPYVRHWHEMVKDIYERSLREGTDNFSKDEKKRVARISYSYYLLALCSEEAGRSEEAEEAYKKAAEYSSGRGDRISYLKVLGGYYHKNEEYGKAFDIWSEILDIEPKFTYGYIMRQEAAYKTRRARQVINDFYDIISFAPNYQMAYVYAAKVFHIYGQNEDFIRVYETAEKNNAVSQLLRYERAKFLKDEEKFEESEALFRQLEEEIAESKTDETEQSGSEAEKQDETEQSGSEGEKQDAPEQSGSEAEKQDETENEDDQDGKIKDLALFYTDFGVSLYDHAKKIRNMSDEEGGSIEELCGRYIKEAWKCVDKGLEIDDKNIYIHWLITDLLELEEKEADEEYKKMIEYFPDNSSVNYEYGRYLERNDRIEEAVVQYKETVRKDPEHQDAYGNLTDYYINRYNETEDEEDYRKAVDNIERQIETCDDQYFRVKQALTYIEGYEFEKALEAAEQAVRQSPDNVFAYNAKGYALMMMDRLEEAEEVFKTGMSYMKTPRKTALQNNLVTCLERQKKFKEAFEFYKKYCEDCHLDSVENREKLAKLAKRMGEYDTAEEYYGKLYDKYESTYANGKIVYNLKEGRQLRLKDGSLISAPERFMLGRLTSNVKCIENNRDDMADLQLTMMDLYVVSGNKKRFNVLSKDIRKYIDLEFGKRNIAVFLNSVMSNDNVRDAAMDRMSAMNMVGMQMLYVSRDYPLAEKCFTMVIKIMERFHEIDGKYGNPNWVATTYMRFAESCYRNKHINAAKKAAEKAMKLFCDGEKDESKYTAYHNFRPKRLEQMAKLYFFMGDRDKAFRLLEEMRECGICSDCHERKCYESYLTLAKLYELSDNNILALEYYQKAHEINSDDAEIENALRALE